MALSAGTRLGPYEITGELGSGGMGVVYSATDTRLNRTVAIKVLPPHVAEREDLRARFEREAQTIAGMSHPHICTLHDVGREAPVGRDAVPPGGDDAEAGEAIDFLVMEYLEGQTLEKRLQRGPLPLAEALEVGIAIADALDKAHRQGVVHRDLKPANVMLTPSGPKLLDFGLAKQQEVEGNDLRSAILTRADVTAEGTVLGTLQYMAPEQVEGKSADARTDIFAFGTLLYEMITGKKAFEGKSQTTLITAIMNRDPRPVSELVKVTPPALEHFLERCLIKEPENRWQSAHTLVTELRWIAYGGTEADGAVRIDPAARKRERVAMAALGAALLLAVALAPPAVLYFSGAGAADGAFAYRTPINGLSDTDIAISPDGATLALVASPQPQGSNMLYVRASNAITSRELAGTADAAQPFWSPDSRFVAFVSGGKLRKIEAAGGPPQDIVDAPGFMGGTWNAQGTIVFGSSTGLFRVSAEGGDAQPLTTVAEPESGHYWPWFLPDGEHFLYSAWSSDTTHRAVWVGSLAGGEPVKLMAAESNAAYAAPGWLLFHREATVFARPFDAAARAFTGEPLRVVGSMSFSSTNGRGNFDVSQSGVLLYVEGAAAVANSRTTYSTNVSWAWLDHGGAPLEAAVPAGEYGDMDASPDDSLIAVTQREGSGTADIWLFDWRREVPTRLTLDPADDINPVFSDDGTRVAFTTWRNGNADVFIRNANGVGDPAPLIASPADEAIEDWSPDGRWIAYELRRDAYEDIWVLPLEGGEPGEPFPIVEGNFHKGEPQFSHDGNWFAYVTDESGAFEVYVMSFPDGQQRDKVSTAGGGQPRWSPDGSELYYRDAEGQIMAAALELSDRLVVRSPQPLFTPAFQSRVTNDPTRHMWTVSADGERFLLRVPGATGNAPGQVPRVPLTAALGGGRRGGFGRFVAPTAYGLTVVRDWPAGLAEVGQ